MKVISDLEKRSYIKFQVMVGSLSIFLHKCHEVYTVNLSIDCCTKEKHATKSIDSICHKLAEIGEHSVIDVCPFKSFWKRSAYTPSQQTSCGAKLC